MRNLIFPHFSGTEIIKAKLQLAKPEIIGITRVRNEELILEDTLKHISKFIDQIIIFDDSSEDLTIKIAQSFKSVCMILKNTKWRNERLVEETRHRGILLNYAKCYKPKWIFCFDADERFEGIMRFTLNDEKYKDVDGIRIKLFDAYMTKHDCNPIGKGEELLNSRKYFGPECRETLMLWKNNPDIRFEGLDQREPVGCKNLITDFFCQHYGKAISTNEWEKTCDYYSTNFPEPYKSKWTNRKGKSIHELSDFETPLYSWDEVKENAIVIYP